MSARIRGKGRLRHGRRGAAARDMLYPGTVKFGRYAGMNMLHTMR